MPSQGKNRLTEVEGLIRANSAEPYRCWHRIWSECGRESRAVIGLARVALGNNCRVGSTENSMRLDDFPPKRQRRGSPRRRRRLWRWRRLVGLPIGGGGLGIGTIVVLGLIGWALGIDPRVLIGGAEIVIGNRRRLRAAYQPPQQTAPHRHADRRAPANSSPRVLGSTEDAVEGHLPRTAARPTARRGS